MPNISVWLSDDQIAKLERLVKQTERSGLRLTRSALVSAAVDAFVLPVWSSKGTNDPSEEQPADQAA